MEVPGTFDVRLLGSVEAIADGAAVSLAGERPRALLAVLAIERSRVVSSTRLIDELWGDDPPARARESLQMHVSRLRRAFGGAGAGQRIVTRDSGCLIELDDAECDLERRERGLTTRLTLRARRPKAGAYRLLVTVTPTDGNKVTLRRRACVR
jgi:DNA-binding SARP family transcriptional activator